MPLCIVDYTNNNLVRAVGYKLRCIAWKLTYSFPNAQKSKTLLLMKINCALPECHDLQHLNLAFEGSGKPIKPAILILDAAKLVEFLFSGDDDFFPGEGRIERIERNFAASNTLELPIIYHNRVAAHYQDGRHRTMALAKRGLKTIPFLTAEAMKTALLTQFGGDKQIGLLEYDFQNCSSYQVYGI